MNIDKKTFALAEGYSSVAEALIMMGVAEFDRAFTNYRHGYNITESKVVTFNNKYIIYNDGKCFSTFSQRFIKPIIVKDGGKEYLVYNIRHLDNPKKKHTIAKLVYYHFGLHDFRRYEEMEGLVIHIDGNLQNNHIDNLMLMSASRMNRHYNIIPKVADVYRFKIPADQVDIVMKMRAEGRSLKSIGKHYNVSEMSVMRFINKNKSINNNGTNN